MPAIHALCAITLFRPVRAPILPPGSIPVRPFRIAAAAQSVHRHA